MAESIKCRGIALIIGVGEYKCPGIGNLANAVRDASAMRLHLEACDYNVQYLQNPSVAHIIDSLKALQIAIIDNSYRNVIIYFAGHGSFDEDAHYLILPEYDSSDESKLGYQLGINAIKADDILDSVCNNKPAVVEELAVVLILDTCREFLPGKGQIRSEQSDRSANLLNQPQKLFNLCYDVRIGILVSYACDIGGKASNRGGNRHGIYTGHILEELQRPGQYIIHALGRANYTVWHCPESVQQPRMESNFPHMFNFSL